MSDAESTALFLTSEDVTGLATPAEYVDAVREGYRERGEGAPPPPNRAVQRRPAGMLTSYTAILPETGAMGGYVYAAGFDERDAYFSLPLFDADSGAPGRLRRSLAQPVQDWRGRRRRRRRPRPAGRLGPGAVRERPAGPRTAWRRRQSGTWTASRCTRPRRTTASPSPPR